MCGCATVIERPRFIEHMQPLHTGSNHGSSMSNAWHANDNGIVSGSVYLFQAVHANFNCGLGAWDLF
jgi:hypothetical protein